jgi:hypothetical protein
MHDVVLVSANIPLVPISTLSIESPPVTSHPIEIGISDELSPETVYKSFSPDTFNDNI